MIYFILIKNAKCRPHPKKISAARKKTEMSFFKKQPKKLPKSGVKLPPVGAWEHYNKKQGIKAMPLLTNKRGRLLIDVSELTLGYESHDVINSLSFKVSAGDYISIVGENGSGKTTLMNTLLGLLPPKSGRITFLDLKRNEIGYLPQISSTENDFPATVYEVVLSGCCNGRILMPRTAAQTAFSNMEKLGITSLSSRRFSELSGGQRQRVLIARALCSAKKLLIMDEPVTALDKNATADMYSLVSDLNRGGLTVISVTHDMRAALKYSNKILYVSHGGAKLLSIDEFSRLEHISALISENGNSEASPYGEGGFRYTGGAV